MSSLFALGSNGSGQLGIGHQEDVSIPTVSTVLNGPPGSVIKKIVAGGNHTLALFSDGHIYHAGENRDGRCLGQGIPNHTTSHEFCPVVVAGVGSDAKFSLCAATWEASFGVLENGRLLSSGTGNRGELGLGQDICVTSEAQVVPNFPPDGSTIIDIAAGMNHVVTVLSNGEVYGWGAGKKGQLGLPRQDSWIPRKIHTSFQAHRVVVGTNFTYVVGDPQAGQHLFIGSDKWSAGSSMPSILPPWQDIAASWGSIFVLLPSGQLLSWGRNDHLQLCPPDLPPVKALAAGSEHVICITKLGQVTAWGWGEHGNCGQEVEDSSFDAKGNILPVHGSVDFVGAGCATSWIGLNPNG